MWRVRVPNPRGRKGARGWGEAGASLSRMQGGGRPSTYSYLRLTDDPVIVTWLGKVGDTVCDMMPAHYGRKWCLGCQGLQGFVGRKGWGSGHLHGAAWGLGEADSTPAMGAPAGAGPGGAFPHTSGRSWGSARPGPQPPAQ